MMKKTITLSALAMGLSLFASCGDQSSSEQKESTSPVVTGTKASADSALTDRVLGEIANTIMNEINRDRMVTALLQGTEAYLVDLQKDSSVPQAKILQVKSKIADMKSNLRVFDLALPIQQEVLAGYKELSKAHPDDLGTKRALSRASSALASTFYNLGKMDQAAPLYMEALALDEALAATEPENTILQNNLVTSLLDVGDIYMAQVDPVAAKKVYERALEIIVPLSEKADKERSVHQNLMTCRTNLGELSSKSGDKDAAREYWTKAALTAKKIAEVYANDPQAKQDLQTLLDLLKTVPEAQ